MSFYSDMAQLAIDMIGDFGRSMTLREYAESGDPYDPVRTPSDTSIIGVVTNFKAMDIDGTLIQKGDKQIFVDAENVPTIAMDVVDNSTVYHIISVDEVKPGDTKILYKIQARA